MARCLQDIVLAIGVGLFIFTFCNVMNAIGMIMSRHCNRISERDIAQPAAVDHAQRIAILTWAGGILAFVSLSLYVHSGASMSFDEALLLALRVDGDPSDPLGPGWLEETGRDLTALGGIPILFLLTLTISGYLLFAHKWRQALILLGATAAALLMSTILKELMDRARPDLVEHGARVYTTSFPSAHAMHSAAVYFTISGILSYYQQRKRTHAYLWGTGAAIVVAVGVSRVYLGVHWPTDVLAGWSAGTACAMVAYLVVRQVLERSEIDLTDPPQDY